MDTATQVQILDEAGYISLNVNLNILPPVGRK